MNVVELINSQYIDGEFNRMDLVVRYMYVKEYVEKNNDFEATDIYLYMVEKRGCFGYKPASQWLLDFNVTIDSIKDNGFDEEFPILVNESNLLWDGSHRLSISFGLGIENVYVEKMNPPKIGRWGFDWFEENNFSSLHLDQINSCFEKYFKVIV